MNILKKSQNLFSVDPNYKEKKIKNGLEGIKRNKVAHLNQIACLDLGEEL